MSPKVWYPANGNGPYPGVIYIPGLNTSYIAEPLLTQWGTFLASHGFAVMFIDSKNLGADSVLRSTALLEAVNALAAETARPQSPLFGKLDADKLAVMGHSFGGSAALYVLNGNKDSRVKAAIGLSPVPTAGFYPNVKAPALMLAGYGDPFWADFVGEYNSIPSTTPKLLAQFSRSAEFSDMHDIAIYPIGSHTTDPVVARIGLAFLQVYLVGDLRYQQFLIKDPSMYLFNYNQ